MTIRIVNDATPTFIIPETRTGVPIPPSHKGRKAKPLNPALVAMQRGQSFVLTGKEQVAEMRSDVQRMHKAHPGVKFVTRTLNGKPNVETFETYPPHTLGVWCVVGVADIATNTADSEV